MTAAPEIPEAAVEAARRAVGRLTSTLVIRAALTAAAPEIARAAKVAGLREEWTVKHSQGIHPGSFTEQSAREWIANSIKADERRQSDHRGKQRLLRRYVTEWEEMPLETEVTS